MLLHYSDNKSEKILTNERLIIRKYGKLAEKIMNRLSELRAAGCLEDIPPVPPPRRHKLVGNMEGHWGIDISKNFRIIIEPYGDFNIDDLSTITEITILQIEDYH